MTPVRLALLVATVALFTAAAAPGLAHEAHGGEIKEQDIDVTLTLAGYGVAELDMDMDRGTRIVWSVESSDQVDVDIHSHDIGVVYHEQHNDTTGVNGTFEAPSDGVFSIAIENGEPVSRSVTLRAAGLFAVVGTLGFHLETEKEESPAPGLTTGLLALTLLVGTIVVRRDR